MILSEGYQRARKLHRCDSCCRQIRKGERYYKQAHTFEGSVTTWKTHAHCRDAENIIWDANPDPRGDGLVVPVSEFDQEDRDIIAEACQNTYIALYGAG